jgi:hypothetical protein
VSYENILYEVQGSMALITINRADRHNAISLGTLDELQAAVASAADDEAVRVWVRGAVDGSPDGADTTPTSARSVEVDCDTGDPLGEPTDAFIVVFPTRWSHWVFWITDPDAGGCHDLVLVYGDGSTPSVHVEFRSPRRL